MNLKYFLIFLLLTSALNADPPFWKYKKFRLLDRTDKFADIDGHMPANHIYKDNDILTYSHETVHGLNSSLRQLMAPKFGNRVSCLYVLNDKFILLVEPNYTLSQVANKVPISIRGSGYQLYLIEQARYWEGQPLYILDELVAYNNSVEVGIEYNIKDFAGRKEKVIEFLNYSIILDAYTWNKFDDQQYSDSLREFILWYTKRIEKNLNIKYSITHNVDCKHLIPFIKGRYSTDW